MWSNVNKVITDLQRVQEISDHEIRELSVNSWLTGRSTEIEVRKEDLSANEALNLKF